MSFLKTNSFFLFCNTRSKLQNHNKKNYHHHHRHLHVHRNIPMRKQQQQQQHQVQIPSQPTTTTPVSPFLLDAQMSSDLVKKAICVTFFAVSEMLPFFETESKGVIHYILNLFGKDSNDNKTDEPS
jgi:hypothetical protein